MGDFLFIKVMDSHNRDKEGPHSLPPPTPPGIRITYHGGSVDYSGRVRPAELSVDSAQYTICLLTKVSDHT
ncbi:MAG: hypothetical protein JRI42_01100 [Deltaproteobacteria bacterium]|nr:hypothetical protein [Deltaproteobacteria bacterium]